MFQSSVVRLRNTAETSALLALVAQFTASQTLVPRPILKKFFYATPLVDSLVVTDTCKRPTNLKRHLCLW